MPSDGRRSVTVIVCRRSAIGVVVKQREGGVAIVVAAPLMLVITWSSRTIGDLSVPPSR